MVPRQAEKEMRVATRGIVARTSFSSVCGVCSPKESLTLWLKTVVLRIVAGTSVDLSVSYLVESALWCLKDRSDNNCLGSHGLEKAVYSRTRSIAEGTSSS